MRFRELIGVVKNCTTTKKKNPECDQCGTDSDNKTIVKSNSHYRVLSCRIYCTKLTERQGKKSNRLSLMNKMDHSRICYNNNEI